LSSLIGGGIPVHATASAPQLTAINPSGGPVGTSVVLTGVNLMGATGISFGATAASAANCNLAGTSCTATAPSTTAGTAANVTLTTAGGTSNALLYTFSAAAATSPTLSTINPSNGAAGTNVTLTGANLAGATAIAFGGTDAATGNCSQSGTSCTVVAPFMMAGTTANVTVTTASGTSNALSYTFGATGNTGSGNAAFTTSPTNAATGQSVNFAANYAGNSSSCGSYRNYGYNFGDGSGSQVTENPDASHVYGNPGTYTATLTVTDCTGANTFSNQVYVSEGAGQGMGMGMSAVSGASGWNLVSGPNGALITGNEGPLYTYQQGNTAYQVVSQGSALRGGQGYWAYFVNPTTQSLPMVNPQTVTITLPAGQWIQIGNAGDTSASVSGADIVYVYNPSSSSYNQTTQLAAGQGAWAISMNGGQATVVNSQF
jgi:PKD repeat protein